MSYAVTADVQARLPGTGNTIGASTQPSSATVTAWIAEADAQIDGLLMAAGIDAPITDARGIIILRSWSCDYAEGHYRNARAAAGGDGTNEDGRVQLERFYANLKKIEDDPAWVAQMLQSGGIAAASIRLRSHATHDQIGRLVDDADFEPQFEKGRGGDQF